MKKQFLFYLIMVMFLVFSSCLTVEERQERRKQQDFFEAIDKEIEVGRAVFAKLAGKYGVVKNKELMDYLNKLGKTLGLYTERQELEYHFAILATEKVNGYALPGGYILISVGALRRIETPGALVGVLSHELGHINLKQILKQVKVEVRYNFFELLARFIAGPRQIVTNMMGQISDKIEEKLFVEGLSRQDEFDADAYSVRLMEALNINPSSYVEFLTKLGSEKGNADLEVLDKTHPPITQRIEEIKKIANFDLPVLQESNQFRHFKDTLNTIKIQEDEETIKSESNENK